jgi:hypothetical protein
VIVVRQVRVQHGEGLLVVDYSAESGMVRRTEIPVAEVVGRLRELKRLTGREPGEEDVRSVIRVMVEAARAGARPWISGYDYEQLIGLDLEAGG